MALGFAALGHEVSVHAARKEDHRGRHGQLDLPVATVQVPGWPSWLRRYRERRERWTARRVASTLPEVDLVYERWTLFSEAGRDRGVPWVLEVNAPLVDERLRFEEIHDLAYARAWERRVLHAADLLVAVSPWLQRWLVDTIGVPAERVVVVENGCRARHAEPADLEGFVIGFLGSCKPWHGHERVENIARLAGGVPLVVTRVEDFEPLVRRMDVALMPYRGDAPPWYCPLKLYDYKAQGTPVVASDIGGLGELVGAGGSVVPADDDAAFAAACRDWRGRRASVVKRPWNIVAAEVLQRIEVLNA
jgi:alpha-maltose-1-phosphate synthase